MDEFLRAQAARGWSGSVLVARGGAPLLLAGYGFADFDAGRANDGDTLFEVASSS
jgi:CubicO group peptidase (beta-lactamase class C family)